MHGKRRLLKSELIDNLFCYKVEPLHLHLFLDSCMQQETLQ